MKRLLLSSIAIGMLVGISPALAESPSSTPAAYQQVPQFYQFPIGSLQVTALSDGTVPLELHKLLTNTSAAQIDALLFQSFQHDPEEASINVFLIKDGPRRILVDAGAGQMFGAGYGGKLLDSLKSSGVRPDEITDVLITHLHSDHVGGLVADGKIVFPNAVLHVSQIDLDFFLKTSEANEKSYGQAYFDAAAEAIGPYQAAGKVKPFSDNETVLPGIVATIHPGHTPGSAFYLVVSNGQSILFVGDIVHALAVQFPKPDVTIAYDFDPTAAARTRQAAFKDIALERSLIAVPHLPFPGVGHISAEGGDAFGWHPIAFRNRDGQ